MKNFSAMLVGHKNFLFLSGWAIKLFEKLSIFPPAHPSRYLMTGPLELVQFAEPLLFAVEAIVGIVEHC